MTDTDRFRVPIEGLRRRQDPAEFSFECTEELEPLTELSGQNRALRFLQCGLGIERPGYNVFVTGLTGTGKATAILEYTKRSVEEKEKAGETRVPDDWCYVFSFKHPDRPNVIRLPAGKARLLQAGLLLPAQDEALTLRATRTALAKLDAEPRRMLE